MIKIEIYDYIEGDVRSFTLDELSVSAGRRATQGESSWVVEMVDQKIRMMKLQNALFNPGRCSFCGGSTPCTRQD